jgi:hypothetical protein
MNADKTEKIPQDLPAVGKAVAILELLCTNDMASGVTELSAKTGLKKTWFTAFCARWSMPVG